MIPKPMFAMENFPETLERKPGILLAPARFDPALLNYPGGLVAGSDEGVVRTLAEVMVRCGLSASLAFTVAESREILYRLRIHLIVCFDRLADGGYEDILMAAEKMRVTVLSLWSPLRANGPIFSEQSTPERLTTWPIHRSSANCRG